MNLNEQIQKLRTAKGLSQGALADALDVSRQSVSKWETGASVPELDKLVKMSELFGVTLDELVTGKAPTPSESAPAAPDWRQPAGLMLFMMAGLCLILTVFFTNPLGLHVHLTLGLAALFALLGCFILFAGDLKVFRLCVGLFGALAVVFLLLSPYRHGLLLFSGALALVLYLWRLRTLDSDSHEAP